MHIGGQKCGNPPFLPARTNAGWPKNIDMFSEKIQELHDV
jgi:hypothetical protein